MTFTALNILPHALNPGRFCFWRRQSVVFFSLCMKYLGNRWMDLRQIHTEDVSGLSLGVWRSRSNVKRQGHQGQKLHFLALSAAWMRFMFG